MIQNNKKIIQNSNAVSPNETSTWKGHTKQQHKRPYKTATQMTIQNSNTKRPYKEFKTTTHKLNKSLLREP